MELVLQKGIFADKDTCSLFRFRQASVIYEQFLCPDCRFTNYPFPPIQILTNIWNVL